MKLSVIIPVHNGGEEFKQCLDALYHSERVADEIIVVDDASTDETIVNATAAGCKVVKLEAPPRGAARARNAGALEADGDTFVFIDADVAVHEDTLGRIEAHLKGHPEAAALFGSYDDKPPNRNTVSLYKNLQHYYVHQKGRKETFTFWAGCGAVRRVAFTEAGGFDEARAKGGRPLMEDIEFGMRMVKRGHIIMLFPDIQVTHLKKWNLASWLRTEIFNRAIPWSKLIATSGEIPNDLNLGMNSRISALTAWLLLFFIIGGFFSPMAWIGAVFSIFTILVLNGSFYLFLGRKGGVFFGIASVGLHIIYFLYSSAVFGAVAAWYGVFRNTTERK